MDGGGRTSSPEPAAPRPISSANRRAAARSPPRPQPPPPPAPPSGLRAAPHPPRPPPAGFFLNSIKIPGKDRVPLEEAFGGGSILGASFENSNDRGRHGQRGSGFRSVSWPRAVRGGRRGGSTCRRRRSPRGPRRPAAGRGAPPPQRQSGCATGRPRGPCPPPRRAASRRR